MDTKSYMKILRSKKRKPEIISMRYSVYYFLRQQKIPLSIIESIFGTSRRSIYYGIEKIKDYLSTNDQFVNDAIKELNSHDIVIRPKSIRLSSGFFTPLGYEMLIDNEIF